MGYIFEHYSLDSWEALFTTLYKQRVVLLSAGAMAKSTKLEDNFRVYKTPTSRNRLFLKAKQ